MAPVVGPAASRSGADKRCVSRTRCAAPAAYRRSGTFANSELSKANSELPKVPVLQRITACCAAPGKQRKKGKRNAERRCSVTAVPHGTARALRRARLSAFHHGTCGSDRTPPLSSSHATSRDLFGAPVPMVRKTERIATHDARPTAGFHASLAGITRAFQSQSQRDCTRRPVVMPVGRVLPKPPESRGDEP